MYESLLVRESGLLSLAMPPPLYLSFHSHVSNIILDQFPLFRRRVRTLQSNVWEFYIYTSKGFCEKSQGSPVGLKMAQGSRVVLCKGPEVCVWLGILLKIIYVCPYTQLGPRNVRLPEPRWWRYAVCVQSSVVIDCSVVIGFQVGIRNWLGKDHPLVLKSFSWYHDGWCYTKQWLPKLTFLCHIAKEDTQCLKAHCQTDLRSCD